VISFFIVVRNVFSIVRTATLITYCSPALTRRVCVDHHLRDLARSTRRTRIKRNGKIVFFFFFKNRHCFFVYLRVSEFTYFHHHAFRVSFLQIRNTLSSAHSAFRQVVVGRRWVRVLGGCGAESRQRGPGEVVLPLLRGVHDGVSVM
jgi:hypothetical protein